MPTDYEKVYQRQRHALGSPAAEFVAFFDHYEKPAADVLDIGCGQGRDALFIARRGHRVVGVDLSPTGIAHLLDDAHAEGLAIEGIVADLSDYEPAGDYDVVVIDRTLHMLPEAVRLTVLARVCRATRPGGFVLLADEKSNIPALRGHFENDRHAWSVLKDARGCLFMQRAP